MLVSKAILLLPLNLFHHHYSPFKSNIVRKQYYFFFFGRGEKNLPKQNTIDYWTQFSDFELWRCFHFCCFIFFRKQQHLVPIWIFRLVRSLKDLMDVYVKYCGVWHWLCLFAILFHSRFVWLWSFCYWLRDLMKTKAFLPRSLLRMEILC